MKRWLAFGLVVALAALSHTSKSFGQGYPPGEAASHMTVPDGLEVSLFASEPMVRQPVCIEFDDRELTYVVAAIGLINMWNRFGVTFQLTPPSAAALAS